MIRRPLLAHLEKFITGVSQVVAIIKSGTTRNALFFKNNYTLGNFFAISTTKSVSFSLVLAQSSLKFCAAILPARQEQNWSGFIAV